MYLFDKALDATMKMLSYDSVQGKPCEESPFGEGVAKCLRFVQEKAEEHGFRTCYGDGYYVYAETGEGDLFGVLGHVDTVPYEGKWDADPLGEIKDGKIYGRGVLDDKGPMICCMYAAFQLLEEGYKPQYRLRFIFGGNEETGWKCIERYMEKEEKPVTGFSPDGDFPVINCERGVAQILVGFEKPESLVSFDGGVRANIVIDDASAVIEGEGKEVAGDKLTAEVKDGKTYIRAKGKPAHGSTPELGDNAVWRILGYAAENFGGEYAVLKEQICDWTGKGLGIAASDYSGALTCNAGIVRVNGDVLEVTLDVRHPNTVMRKSVEEKLAEQRGVKSVTTQHFHDPHFVDENEPLVQGLLGAYNTVVGTDAKPFSIGGATYARALEHGVAFGPMFPWQESTIHQKNEHATIEDFKKMYDVYYEALKRTVFSK